ncbi:MAG: PQQ-dependent sugar dehydrogenase [Candidatus Nitrosocosmicus sp.]
MSLTMIHFNYFHKPYTRISFLNRAFAQYAVASASPFGPSVADPNLKVQMVFPTAGKETTSMAFLSLNDILVLDKNTGKVNRVVNGKLLPKPVLDVPVANKIERGLLGIAVAPSLSPDGKRYVYLYYTQSGGTTDGDEFRGLAPPKGNMVYRYEFSNGKLINPLPLLQLPANPGMTKRPDHNGGKLAIGSDGNVYAVIGEVGGHVTQAENNINGGPPDGTGGILRITPNGQSVPNSPFGDNAPLSFYFAYGVRNSFGIAFDPVTGNLWDTENGPNYGDEINLVKPGFNSGWAIIQGFAKSSHLGHINPSDVVKLKGSQYSDPKFEWADPVGPTALVFLNSDKLGTQYKDDLFVGDVNNGNLYHFKLSEDRDQLLYSNGQPVEDEPTTSAQIPLLRFGIGFGGITDLQTGPDGFLYVLNANGAIFRIVPASFAAANPTPYTFDSLTTTNQNQQQQQQPLSDNGPAVLSAVSNAPNKVTIVGVKGNQSYDPNPINIKVGDTITWINADVIAHTVTSGKDYDPITSGKIFNSKSIISNGVYRLKFTIPGVFDYFCLFHPNMKGEIVVSK